MVGAVLGSVWGWTGTFAGAWAGVWFTSWGFDLYKTLNGSVFLTLGGTVVAGMAVGLASQKLLQSIGKWKAMQMLLGTGFAGLFVGLLVRVLFVR